MRTGSLPLGEFPSLDLLEDPFWIHRRIHRRILRCPYCTLPKGPMGCKAVKNRIPLKNHEDAVGLYRVKFDQQDAILPHPAVYGSVYASVERRPREGMALMDSGANSPERYW